MVTFDNEPLNQGYLTFQPEPDTPGPSTAADIVEGNFSIPSQMEVLPGTFRIQIEFHRPSGEKQKKPRNGELFEVQEQFIPARYNSASTLTVEVKNNQRNRFEFTLVNE